MIFWGEHLFFEKRFESSQEFEVQKLHIQVMDHNALISDSLIGEFEIDLVSVYFSDKHAIQHQWVALSNMKKNFQEIKGFLKFSASCVGPGDEQVALEPEPFKKGDEKQMFGAGGVGQLGSGKVMLPPQIQTKGYQMIVKLIKAESLPKMDTMGSIDTYLLIEFGSALYKTKTVKNSLCPFWGYTVYVNKYFKI